MPEPDKPPCPLCNGAEVVYIDNGDTDVEACRCLKARLLKQHLGPEIASAPTILGSPLLVVKNDEVVVDRTKENLFIKAAWPDLLPHLKWAFYCKGTRFTFRVITDEKIKTVFVGSESYTSRAKGKRDDMLTMNSLADLVGSDYALVIIRLGYLGHKNIAASGALKEALMLREVACLPTWIIEKPTQPFYECHAYSDDTAAYIEQHFETVTLGQSTAPRRAPVRSEPIEDVSFTEDPSEMEPVVAERAPTPAPVRVARAPEPTEDIELPGSNAKKQWGKKKRSNGDEGPV